MRKAAKKNVDDRTTCSVSRKAPVAFFLSTKLSHFTGLTVDYERRLGEMTKFGLTALEAFTVDNALYCPEENLLSCRFKRMFDVIDESYPVSR